MNGLKQRISRLKPHLSRLKPRLPDRGAAGPQVGGADAGRRRWWSPAGRRAEAPAGQQPLAPAGQDQEPLAPAGQDPPTPAGQDPQEQAVPARPSFRDRGRLRRRLRYLRRARELGFRDLGGLVFDLRRFERDRPDLIEAKLGAIAAVDQELRTLEVVLDDRRPLHELREPGISSCARCGALHSSDANFCPHCGLQLSGPRAMGEIGGAIAAPPQAPPDPGAAPPAPAAPTAPPDEQQTQTFEPQQASDRGS